MRKAFGTSVKEKEEEGGVRSWNFETSISLVKSCLWKQRSLRLTGRDSVPASSFEGSKFQIPASTTSAERASSTVLSSESNAGAGVG